MASVEVGSLYYDLDLKDDTLHSKLRAADGAVKSLGDNIGKYWDASATASKRFAATLAVVGAGVIAFGISSVKSFEDSQNKIAQTNAVLKSTAGIAGVTADSVDKLSKSLERQTKYSDEDVRSVENLLLTFTSIGKDIFPQATKTVLDMATALGEDTSSASIQLGKALQDPILGVTALRRVGVNFSEDQKKVIQNLVETGKKAEAQRLILKELNTEFGGSAAAAANTFAGKLAILKNEFDDVKESIGQLIVKVAEPLITALLNWFDKVGGVDGALKSLREQFDKIKPYLPEIAGAIIGLLLPAFLLFVGALARTILLMSPWILLGEGIVIIAQRLGIKWSDVGKVLEKIKPFIDRVWQALTQIDDIARTLIERVELLWTQFTHLSAIVIIAQHFQQELWPAIKAVASAITDSLLPAWGQLWDAVVRLWNALNPALMDALKIIAAVIGITLYNAILFAIQVLNVAVQVFSVVISVISNVINWISNLISWFGTLAARVGAVVGAVISFFRNLIPATADVVNIVIGSFMRLYSSIIGLFVGAGGWLVGAGRNIIGGLINGILALAGALLNAVSAVSAQIGRFFAGAGNWLYGVGRAVVQGLINGMTSMIGGVAGAAANIANAVKNKVTDILHIRSPSRVFMEIGKNVSEGFAMGINNSRNIALDAMSGFANNVISPTLQLNPATATSNAPAPVTSPGGTVVNIGQINNDQDEAYVLRRLDRNQLLVNRGGSQL
jgi:phage-related protein